MAFGIGAAFNVQRRPICRGRATDQVRAGRQRESRQGARPYRTADAAHARRRGDRVRWRESIPLVGRATSRGFLREGLFNIAALLQNVGNLARNGADGSGRSRNCSLGLLGMSANA
jgi:hypothetical protein